MSNTRGIVQLTRGESLSCGDLKQAAFTLRNGGIAIVPSDTCYALAALPFLRNSMICIVSVLPGKVAEPIPLVFGSIPLVERYVKLTLGDERLIDRYWPGPLTLVCEINGAHEKHQLQDMLHTAGTIGVRHSDSLVERQLSDHLQRPITTCAIRYDSGEPVRTFDDALSIVRARMQEAKNRSALFSISLGHIPYQDISTVAAVQRAVFPSDMSRDPDDSVFVFRNGAIEPKDLKRTVRELSASDWIDWT